MKQLLVLPDIHLPREDRRTMKAVEEYMGSKKWDGVINLGDFMDFDCISSHNINNLRGVEGNSITKDYDYANQVLDRHQRILGNTPYTYLQGNHEYRVERLVDAQPRLEGSIEVDTRLHLKDRGIRWVKSWEKGEVHREGKAAFIHGLYTNDLHAKQHVTKYGENIFYGHLHDLQSYSLTRNGDNKTIVGQSLGCLCNYKQFYMKGRPNRWQQAITVFHIFPDGYFSYFICSIFNHRFVSPEGDVYKA